MECTRVGNAVSSFGGVHQGSVCFPLWSRQNGSRPPQVCPRPHLPQSHGRRERELPRKSRALSRYGSLRCEDSFSCSLTCCDFVLSTTWKRIAKAPGEWHRGKGWGEWLRINVLILQGETNLQPTYLPIPKEWYFGQLGTTVCLSQQQTHSEDLASWIRCHSTFCGL